MLTIEALDEGFDEVQAVELNIWTIRGVLEMREASLREKLINHALLLRGLKADPQVQIHQEVSTLLFHSLIL
jgi:hypothetical protein